MFNLAQKQDSRRNKVRAVTEGISKMETLIVDQQLRIEELEKFILWIYEVSSEGKISNTNITNAIQNFNSVSSVSSVTKKSQFMSNGNQEQRNLTFFPISAASSINRQQIISMQSVPMHQSNIGDIQFSESVNHVMKLGHQLQLPPLKNNILKPSNRPNNNTSPSITKQ